MLGTSKTLRPIISCFYPYFTPIRQCTTTKTTTTTNIFIDSLIQQARLQNTQQSVHRKLTVTDNGLDQDDDPCVATKLIVKYSKLGSIDNARQVFDKMRNRTTWVWNVLFRAMAVAGDGEEVFNLYRMMNVDGVMPDNFTYTFVLKACLSGETTLLVKVNEIHGRILRHGYGTHVHVMTTLVDVYGKFGCVWDARFVFDEMPMRVVVSWSAMIACYARNGCSFEALGCFSDMMLENNGLLPNSVTMVSVVQACTELAALEQGKVLHGYVLRKGLDSILPVVNALVTMYAKCGELELGHCVFNQMVRRDVVSWNSMISSYGVHGFGRKAVEVFKEMLFTGIQPSYISFVSVLGACSHEGLVEEGKSLFESMVKEHGMYPTIEHYACLVDILGRANRLDEAAKVIEEMPIEPGPTVWGSLLGSCRIHCNVEFAERACKRLFELEPENAGNYELMAEIYAKAEMFNEAKKIKELQDALGIQILPGCSRLEVSRKLYSFTSTNKLDPENEQIHALLLKLSNDTRAIGYVPQEKELLCDIGEEEKERIGHHSEKLALAFGLINCKQGAPIKITKNLRLCEDCHSFTKFVSQIAHREIVVRDINRIHHFRDGVCSCGDYW